MSHEENVEKTCDDRATESEDKICENRKVFQPKEVPKLVRKCFTTVAFDFAFPTECNCNSTKQTVKRYATSRRIERERVRSIFAQLEIVLCVRTTGIQCISSIHYWIKWNFARSWQTTRRKQFFSLFAEFNFQLNTDLVDSRHAGICHTTHILWAMRVQIAWTQFDIWYLRSDKRWTMCARQHIIGMPWIAWTKSVCDSKSIKYHFYHFSKHKFAAGGGMRHEWTWMWTMNTFDGDFHINPSSHCKLIYSDFPLLSFRRQLDKLNEWRNVPLPLPRRERRKIKEKQRGNE